MDFTNDLSAPGQIMRVKKKLLRLGLILLFLICGLLIFFFGSSYFSLFPTNQSDTYRFALAVLSLLSAVVLRRSANLRDHLYLDPRWGSISRSWANALLPGNSLSSGAFMGIPGS
jgi:hypothetical protein